MKCPVCGKTNIRLVQIMATRTSQRVLRDKGSHIIVSADYLEVDSFGGSNDEEFFECDDCASDWPVSADIKYSSDWDNE